MTTISAYETSRTEHSGSTGTRTAAQAAAQTANSVWDTDIDGVIQDTKQGETGDCWLLTELNCLRDTEWGAKMIKDAVKKDGNGGVIITFKGSKGTQKEFRVSAKEITAARKSGKYSSGDDDVIAFELAMGKYLRLYGTLHGIKVNQNAAPGEFLDDLDGGMGIYDFIELLSGKKIDQEHLHVFICPKETSEMSKILDEIEKNPNKYCIFFTFKSNCTVYSDTPVEVITNHAYQLKKVVTENGKKYVIFTNPWDSSQEHKLDYDDFIGLMLCLDLVENPENEPNENVESLLEKRLHYYKYITAFLEGNDGEKKAALKQVADHTNKNTINLLFCEKKDIKLWIETFDMAEFGQGHGKAKKALIEPVVNAYCDYALEKGVDQSFVDEVRKACMAELDAVFYTDEKVIIKKLEALYDKICSSGNITFGI